MSAAAPALDGSRSVFEARTAPVGRWPTVSFVGAQVALVAWYVFGSVLRLPWSTLTPLNWALGLAVAIAWAASVRSWARPRQVLLEIRGGQLLVNGGERAYSLSRVLVGEWREFGSAVRKGTVLHVGSRARTLRIAVMDQVLGQEFGATATATTLVDLVADPDVFAALRASILEPVPPPFATRREGLGTRRWELTPNRKGWVFQIQSIASMLLWSCGCVLLAGICAPTPFELSTLGSVPQGATLIALAGGIIGWPLLLWYWSGLRRHAIEFSDDGEARLVDMRRGAVLARAPAGQSAARATYFPPWWLRPRGGWEMEMKRRYGTYSFPVLLFRWPTGRVTSIAIRDWSVAWLGDTAKTSAPAYLVGTSDWRSLSDALGLRKFVVEKESNVRG